MRAGRRSRGHVTAVAVAVVLALAAGCGGGDGSDDVAGSPTSDPQQADDGSATPGEQTSTPSEDVDDAPGEADDTDQGTRAPDADGPDDAALAGTPVDLHWRVGDRLAVVGVATDDVLHVRATPGADGDVVGSLGPLEADVEVVGETRMLPRSWWLEVAADGTTGWVNVRHLAFVGATFDATARIRPHLPDGGRAASLQSLADAIATVETAGQTETGLRVVVVDGPSVGDLAEITVDVLGIGDDAVLGGRYHVFAEPPGGDGEVALRSVEVTTLCARGVTEDGACV